MSSTKTSKRGSRGGRRENAGRKPIWRNKDTCTIRVPKVIANQVMKLAHKLDCEVNIDNDTKSNTLGNYDLVMDSKSASIEIFTQSNRQDNDLITKSLPSLDEALPIAKQILKHKKSARQTVSKLLSKLYSTRVAFEDLK